MNCYDCATQDHLARPAVAVCHDCGAAVCDTHAVARAHHLTRIATILREEDGRTRRPSPALHHLRRRLRRPPSALHQRPPIRSHLPAMSIPTVVPAPTDVAPGAPAPMVTSTRTRRWRTSPTG